MPWILALGVFMLLAYFVWRAKNGGAAPGVLAFGKSRGRLLEEGDEKTTFADVAGVEEAKEELQEIVSFLSTPEKYRRLGAKIPKGVLLVGPPGTGKTLLARAVAGEADVPFISISGSEFVEMLVGVGAARVRDLFAQAVQNAPCIVFIDELDAIGRSRSSIGGVGSHEEREQTLNQLLVEMDGFKAHETVIVMAATNRPEILDPALLRPGRFDRQVLVDVPDRAGREAILEVHSQGVRISREVDLAEVAKRTPGFAGADLANLINEAALLAARRNEDHVGMDAFGDAIDRVVAGLKKKNRMLTEEDKRRVAYHEVGHALAGTLAGGESRVHKISIVPRGMAALGFTMNLPEEERYLMTETAMRASLVGLLGGRAAEEVVFGEASTGAQNDLQRATDIARSMVLDYGMSDAVGPVSVTAAAQSPFLQRKGSPTVQRREVGEHLADTIDGEIRRIVEEALARARGLLEQNRTLLERMSDALLVNEVLEGERLDEFLEEARALRTKPERQTGS
ncbi:MAG: ATP-dependent zinc metalloprotease FtsH [Myxococcota bacterium]